MIFVTVGTNEAPFDRLLRAVEPLAHAEDVLVQHGASLVRPAGARCVDYLSYDEMGEVTRNARVVISHAGVGSIMTALANAKRPFVVPRRKDFGEAVDDHQIEVARAVASVGLVETVEDPATLVHAVSADSGQATLDLRPARELVEELRAYIARHAGGGPERA